MSSQRPSSDDLLVLSRRGALGEAEERLLEQAVRDSLETRVLLRALEGFEHEAPVAAGDDERIARVVRAVGRAAAPRRRSQVWLVLSAAMVGALFASIVIAAVSRYQARSRPPSAPTAPAPRELSAPAAHDGALDRAPTPNEREASSASALLAPSPAALTPARTPVRTGSEPPRAPLATVPNGSAVAAFPTETPSADAPSPSVLFAAANAARVGGDDARAAALYRRLQSEFKGSSEAHASLVSLGMILLRQGTAAAALDSFRAYATQGGGATLAEALWGEAQALDALGRRDEERGVLGELLARYPGSAYSAAAEKRRRELN